MHAVISTLAVSYKKQPRPDWQRLKNQEQYRKVKKPEFVGGLRGVKKS